MTVRQKFSRLLCIVSKVVEQVQHQFEGWMQREIVDDDPYQANSRRQENLLITKYEDSLSASRSDISQEQSVASSMGLRFPI